MTGGDVIIENKMANELAPYCEGNGSLAGGGKPATVGHIYGMGNTLESKTVLVYGCKGRGAQRHGPFKHDKGTGYVKFQPGQYHDALRVKRTRVVLGLVTKQGGVARPTLAQFRRWSQRAARGAGVDRTKYGTTRRCTKDHFTHHTRMYSKTAVVENAAAMCRVLTKKKALLFSAAHAATPDAATRA